MLSGTLQREIDLLGEGEALAVVMVDQVEWIDLLDDRRAATAEAAVEAAANGDLAVDPLVFAYDYGVPTGDGSFRREASAYVRRPASRNALKQIVGRMAGRVRRAPMALRMLPPHDVEVACELVTSATKAWLQVMGRRDVDYRARRLVIKFEPIDAPWVQDPQRGTLHAVG